MKKLPFLFLLMILLSLFPISVKADDPTSFELLPNSLSVDYGETFNISIYISPNASINAIAIDELTFDSSVITLEEHNSTDNVSKGNIFESGTTLLWRSGVIDNTSGNLTDVAWVTTPAYSGEGYFCNLTFTATGVGSTYINLTDVSIVYDIYEWDYQIISNASITVNYNVTTNATIQANETTNVEETTASLNGFIGHHSDNPSATIVTVGFVYDTTTRGAFGEWANNVTYGIVTTNNVSFSKAISGLQEAEYYYVRAWANIVTISPPTNTWILSNETYFLTKPDSPSNLTVETVGDTSVELSWDETTNFGAGTTIRTVVRYKKNEYPSSVTDGTLAYNGTGETNVTTGLDDDTRYYFRAWTCAGASGSPQLYQYSDSFDSITGSTFNGTYNISIRYENRTYGFVNLSRGHYHEFIVYYTHATEHNNWNNTGIMNSGGNDSQGDWSNSSNGWFTITTDRRPLFFSFHWNASDRYITEAATINSTVYSCYRVIVPDDDQRNITFYIRDDLPVYEDSSVYMNDSLVRYTMSFIDSSGEFIPENNPYSTIYAYDDDDNKMVIHSEFFDASKQVIPWLIHNKRYYIGVDCDEMSFERISTFIAGDDQNPKIIIPYRHEGIFNFYSIINLRVGWYGAGFYVDFEDTTGYTTNVSLYIWGYENDTLMPGMPITKYVPIYNFTYPCNTSLPWKWNMRVDIDDIDTDDDVNYSGIYWLAGEYVIIYPGIDEVIDADDIDDFLELLFGDSPMYDDDGNEVRWTYIALFGISFLLLLSFGKINAFIGSLSVGFFLLLSGGFIFGLVSAVVIVGAFIIALSFVGLLGGVDTR